MPKHSKAPFKIDRNKKKGWACLDSADGSWYSFARVVTHIDGDPYEEGEANLRLFLAAPDMLEELEEAMRIIDDLDHVKVMDFIREFYRRAKKITDYVNGLSELQTKETQNGTETIL